MQGETLRLGKLWTIGERIGGGGFGDVFAASSDGTSAALKLVRKEPGAQRELLFVDLAGARNVVPVIDQGETEDAWVLVMPRAEMSLRDLLLHADSGVGTGTSVAVLADIAAALSDLAGRLVHRDLKPENVLLLDGNWSLADFGISRFAEATTAPDTRKFAKTPAYAAPEQWRDERATSATDVYALGVIAYELLTGRRPFSGPDIHDLRQQHLHEAPAPLRDVPTTLAALVEECLYKQAEARPRAVDIERRLGAVLLPAAAPGLVKLQEAHHQHVGKQADQDRRSSLAATSAERRTRLQEAARQNFVGISTAVPDALQAAAPAARCTPATAQRNGQWSLRLGQATLDCTAPSTTSAEPWGRPGHQPFDVVAFAILSLTIPMTVHGYEGRSHALWYCDPIEEDRFGWYELAFVRHPLTSTTSSLAPYALPPGPEAAGALAPGMDVVQLAWPFTRLTGEDLSDLINRWAGWLADASSGASSYPGTMPEVPVLPVWRR